jgi:hypothetical protein
METCLLARKGITERSADNLEDCTFHVLATKRRLGQVTMIDISREDDYRGWRLALLSGPYGLDQVGNLRKSYGTNSNGLDPVSVGSPLPTVPLALPIHPNKRPRSRPPDGA